MHVSIRTSCIMTNDHVVQLYSYSSSCINKSLHWYYCIKFVASFIIIDIALISSNGWNIVSISYRNRSPDIAQHYFKATIWIVLTWGPYNYWLFNAKIQLCLIQAKLAQLILEYESYNMNAVAIGRVEL